METFIGILIPFIGTTLGSACVFFMKKSLSNMGTVNSFAQISSDILAEV